MKKQLITKEAVLLTMNNGLGKLLVKILDFLDKNHCQKSMKD